jgi:putative membrane protein
MHMKNKITFIYGISLALCAFGAAGGQGTRTGELPAPDDKFVQDAVAGGKTEVQMGHMASDKATSSAVRDYGTQMARDHEGLNTQLDRILAEQGITEPGATEKMTRSGGALEGASGPDFDRAYMRDAVDNHKKDIAAFKKEAAEGRDPEIRNWAAQSLPILENHLKMAEQTESSLPK